MRKFETGKRYNSGAMVYEITKRTAKTVTFKEIDHAGRYNERITKEGRAIIKEWPEREVFIIGTATIEA